MADRANLYVVRGCHWAVLLIRNAKQQNEKNIYREDAHYLISYSKDFKGISEANLITSHWRWIMFLPVIAVEKTLLNCYTRDNIIQSSKTISKIIILIKWENKKGLYFIFILVRMVNSRKEKKKNYCNAEWCSNKTTHRKYIERSAARIGYHFK